MTFYTVEDALDGLRLHHPMFSVLLSENESKKIRAEKRTAEEAKATAQKDIEIDKERLVLQELHEVRRLDVFDRTDLKRSFI